MMDRFAVLELTHIERKLKSEVEALVTYATDPRRTSPITAKEAQDASKAYRHYTTKLTVLLLNTQQFFDDTARLVQPYYRQALSTNMRLSLEDRGTEGTTAFLFVEALRNTPPAAPTSTDSAAIQSQRLLSVGIGDLSMEITNEQLEQLTSFNAEATFYIGELEQLELTPVEYVFCSDTKATLGATIQFANTKLYNDAQLFSAAMFSSHILLQCLRHDAQFYANYFNDIGEMRELYEVQKQELHGSRILPLYLRDDMIAKNFRGE